MTSKNAYVVVYQIACQHALKNFEKFTIIRYCFILRSSAIQ